MREHRAKTRHPRDATLAALEEAAQMWGAAWQPDGWGGRLELPVTAGLRRGVVRGRVSVEAAANGSRILFRVEESRHTLNVAAVVVLLMGGFGGLAATLWPFFPPLLSLAPLSVVLALAAWLLVASRVRTSGPEDFLELVATLPDEVPEPNDSGQYDVTTERR